MAFVSSMSTLRSTALFLAAHLHRSTARAPRFVVSTAVAQAKHRHFSSSRTVRSNAAPLDVAEQALETLQTSSTSAPPGFFTSSAELFLSLPDLLPFHTSYAVSIVLLTLFLRCSITLPLIVWQRKRTRRVGELVLPEVKAWMAKAKYAMRAEFRKQNRDYRDYVLELNKRSKLQFKLVSAKYKCRSWPTLLLPPMVHLPVFISTTLVLREACTRSAAAISETSTTASQLALESLAWCPSLAEVDPSVWLPLAVSLSALTNVEIQQSLRQNVAKSQTLTLDEQEAPTAKAARSFATVAEVPQQRPASVVPSAMQKRRASTTASPPVPEEEQLSNAAIRGKALTNVLRGASIAFLPISAFTPAAVNLYWLTSNLFSIAQNLVLGYRDRQERKAN